MLFWLTVVTMILAGALAAAPLILGNRPDSKALFDKLMPFEGIIGGVALVLGVIYLIDSIQVIDVLFSNIRGILLFSGVLSLLLTGFLLSLGILGKLLGPGVNNVATKLMPFKAIIGLVCALFGVLCIILYFTK